MMANSVMTPEAFFEELKLDPVQRYAFVLGNGINYYLRNSVVSWKELLDNFIRVNKDSLEELSFASQSKDVTNTEIVNLIEVFADKELGAGNPAAAMRKKLMAFLKERLSFKAPGECALLDAAWGKHHILTTNFDESIEKYISRSIKRRLKGCEAKARNKEENVHSNNGDYPWNRFWGLKDCPKERSPLDHHNTIWHIHGKLDNKTSCSVLFSLTRYVNAIKRVELWKMASPEKWPGRNTWVNIFYNEPLIIAGLGLENQEVFLRTLLIERNRHWKKQKKDGKIKKEPKSFYLVRKTDDDKKATDGRAFLRALGFEVVEFESTEDLYNNNNWKVER